MKRLNLIFIFLSFFLNINAQTRFLEQDMILVKGGIDTVYIVNEDQDLDSISAYLASSEIPDFYVGKYCVSVLDFKTFCKRTNREMPPAPSWGWGDLKKPMVNITHQEALDFCKWLSDSLDVSFRLPTSHEWEYLANEGRFVNHIYNFTDQDNLEDYAEFKENNRNIGKPNCITCKNPNTLGVYDLLGNVWEIVDWGGAMGGSFNTFKKDISPSLSRSIETNERATDVGFRIVANAREFEKYVLNKENGNN